MYNVTAFAFSAGSLLYFILLMSSLYNKPFVHEVSCTGYETAKHHLEPIQQGDYFPLILVTPSQTRAIQRLFHASRLSYAPKDPYQVLGVSRDSSPAEIKKVYFSVRDHFVITTHLSTEGQLSWRANTIQIQTPTKTRRRSLLKFKRHMMCVGDLDNSYLCPDPHI